MRRRQKNLINELIGTLFEAQGEVKKLVQKKGNVSLALGLLEQCQQGAVRIGTLIEEETGEDFVTVKLLEEYCELVYQVYEALAQTERTPENSVTDKTHKMLRKKLIQVQQSVKDDVLSRITAVFLPYKASMWTALESIWMAADRDPDCDAIVMPVPYYQLDRQLQPIKLCYEGDQFPEYVPITPYDGYSIEDNRPDLVFVHNPYDNCNTVTYVLDQFHSSHLKNYTECLVYVPYFTYGGYKKGTSDHWFQLPGTIHCHKMVLQSEKLKRVFVENYGYDEDKFLVTGSPKMDAVVNKMKKKIDMPEEWKPKLSGKKKIFLLNTHMMYFINLTNYARTIPSGINYGIKYHQEILDAFANHPECGLIWRPHPLMKAVINENYAFEEDFKASLDFVEKMERAIEVSDNCVIDRSGDYKVAFYHSDALISTYSSLVQEYMATGKPVLIFQTKQTEEAAERGFINYRSNYFKFPPDNISFEKFINMVVDRDDPMQEERICSIRESFLNLDGTAGETVYAELCKEINV